MDQYDLIVIGAGSAGLVAATSGHRAGLKTALIEKRKIGGECTHSGCVPSKALLNAAKHYKALDNFKTLGLGKPKKSKVNFAKVMDSVQGIIDGIYEHEKPELFQDMGIDTIVHKSGARFIDKNTIQVGKRKLTSKAFVICTGSSPRIIPIKGFKEKQFLHNDNFWKLRKQPKHIVFVGGGVISVELGSALRSLGSKVTILEYASKILGPIDSDVTDYMVNKLKEDGISIKTNVRITGIKRDSSKLGNKVCYTIDGRKNNVKADFIFQSVGRQPNTEGLDLDKASIKFSPKGIETDKFLETSQKNIFACGDCTTPLKFTHTASHQANIIINNLTQKKKKENDLSVLPWAVFTSPEIGHVGLTQQEAENTYGKENITVFKVDAAIDRFITDRKTGGFIKVVFNDKDQVLGADAIGAHAGEWIQLITFIIKNNISAPQVADTIFAYPTYSEIIKKVFTRYLRSKV